jgi:hypothetical protein
MTQKETRKVRQMVVKDDWDLNDLDEDNLGRDVHFQLFYVVVSPC